MHKSEHKMYFIAVVCPPQIDEHVVHLKHWMRERFGCKAALKSPAHITLVAPFWLEQTSEQGLVKIFDDFRSTIQAFPITLNHFSHFGNRVLFVHVEANEELAMLQSQVETYLQLYYRNEVKIDQRPFHPHVTIANRDMNPSSFHKAWEHFSRTDFYATFTCSVVSLLKLSEGKWKVIRENQFTS